MALSFTSRITLTSGNNNVRSHGLIGTRRRHFFQRIVKPQTTWIS